MIDSEYPDGLTRGEWLERIEERRNPFYQYPSDHDALLWRYMDFAKFTALLSSSGLFFPSAIVLDDALEGSVSPLNLEARRTEIKRIAKHFSESSPEGQSPVDLERQLVGDFTRSFDARASIREWSRYWTYISCWHLNDTESAAMWKLYGTHEQSVAVISTFERLKSALRPHMKPPHGEPKLGLVHYQDYLTDPVRTDVHLSEYFYKRKSFSHEVELRAVIQDLPRKPAPGDSQGFHYDVSKLAPPGKVLSVDLGVLVKEIRVSPSAADWFFNLVDNVTKTYELECPVTRSDLNTTPVY